MACNVHRDMATSDQNEGTRKVSDDNGRTTSYYCIIRSKTFTVVLFVTAAILSGLVNGGICRLMIQHCGISQNGWLIATVRGALLVLLVVFSIYVVMRTRAWILRRYCRSVSRTGSGAADKAAIQ